MKVEDSRIEIKEVEDNTYINIKAYTEPAKQSILFAWILAWTGCGFYIISQYFQVQNQQEKLFFIVFIGFWLYFEYKAVYAYRWRRRGWEEIIIDKDRVSLAKMIGKRGIPRFYDIEYIKDIRPLELSKSNFSQSVNNAYWNVGGERIVFDYKGRSIVFGMHLNTSTVNALVKQMRHMFNK